MKTNLILAISAICLLACTKDKESLRLDISAKKYWDQEDLDKYGSILLDSTEIFGDMRLYADVTDFSALRNIERIHGELTLWNNQSDQLSSSFFPHLREVKTLRIYGSESIERIELSSLEAVYELLIIANSQQLKEIELPQLKYSKHLAFQSNPALVSLALPELLECHTLWVRDNEHFRTLSGGSKIINETIWGLSLWLEFSRMDCPEDLLSSVLTPSFRLGVRHPEASDFGWLGNLRFNRDYDWRFYGNDIAPEMFCPVKEMLVEKGPGNLVAFNEWYPWALPHAFSGYDIIDACD
jgi:hypothetical protein